MRAAMIFRTRKKYVRHSMNAFLWSNWNTVARLGIPKPSAAELALLILLGASLLALRSLRENYLKLWICGWLCLVVSRFAEHSLAGRIPAPFDLVVVQATFVLAVGLLAGAVLLYTRTRDLLLPLMVITPILVGFRRCASSFVARFPASPDGFGTRLPVCPADCRHHASSRPARTLGACRVAAGDFPADFELVVAVIHRPCSCAEPTSDLRS